jgi:ApaG protein
MNEYAIEVKAQSYYVEAQSNPHNHRYVFAYTIVIHNIGLLPAKLLSRHWIITDADGKVQEVTGAGVVGEQPYLRPGERFEYTSAAMLETPLGTMQGSYQMRGDNGDIFETPIAPFRLALPYILH